MSYYNDDVHTNQCENAEYFFCATCRELVHDSQKNICPDCLKFIPRVQGCICDYLPESEPDWDSVRKDRMENPR